MMAAGGLGLQPINNPSHRKYSFVLNVKNEFMKTNSNSLCSYTSVIPNVSNSLIEFAIIEENNKFTLYQLYNIELYNYISNSCYCNCSLCDLF